MQRKASLQILVTHNRPPIHNPPPSAIPLPSCSVGDKEYGVTSFFPFGRVARASIDGKLLPFLESLYSEPYPHPVKVIDFVMHDPHMHQLIASREHLIIFLADSASRFYCLVVVDGVFMKGDIVGTRELWLAGFCRLMPL